MLGLENFAYRTRGQRMAVCAGRIDRVGGDHADHHHTRD